jgi:hypothetical protein
MASKKKASRRDPERAARRKARRESAAPATVKKAAQKAVKESGEAKQAVKKAAKEASQGLSAAKAAKRVADKCAADLKKKDAQIQRLQTAYTRAERAIAIGNIGRGLGTVTHGTVRSARAKAGREKAKVTREAKKAIRKVSERAEEAFMLGNVGRGLRALEAPKARPKPSKRKPPVSGVKAPAIPKAARPTPTKKPPKKPAKASTRGKKSAGERDVTADQILAGAKGGKGATKAYEFWQCAGPVRSGCGHKGAFVVGDYEKRPAIRLRGVQPLPT